MGDELEGPFCADHGVILHVCDSFNKTYSPSEADDLIGLRGQVLSRTAALPPCLKPMRADPVAMPLKADEVGSLVNVDFGILGRVQKLRCIRFHPVLHEGTRMACQHFYLRVVQFLEMCSYRRREDCIAFPALPFDAVN